MLKLAIQLPRLSLVVVAFVFCLTGASAQTAKSFASSSAAAQLRPQLIALQKDTRNGAQNLRAYANTLSNAAKAKQIRAKAAKLDELAAKIKDIKRDEIANKKKAAQEAFTVAVLVSVMAQATSISGATSAATKAKQSMSRLRGSANTVKKTSKKIVDEEEPKK